MPKVLKCPQKPIHIHIKKGEGEAKFWVTPSVTLAESWNLRVSELTRAQKIVVEHRQEILAFWNRYFSAFSK
jgi:hypothetical protein